ncbi:hypothetical protein [Clostridium sp. WB02_MRS01]|uniref:hypothetical protein n=1 Tax=Clostridium sp. WB02_MRS01 TaxID=2605777 RepID=UPI0012B3064B|nr:hypothetical protein [Clostridium sp. WB02_MRS01]
MKTKNMIIIAAALVISAFFVGKQTNTDTINMNQVVDIQASEYGAQIVLSDGNGYYWER